MLKKIKFFFHILSFFKDLLPILKDKSEVILKIKVDNSIYIIDYSVNQENVLSSLKFLPGSELSNSFKIDFIKTFGRIASKSNLRSQ